MDKLIKAIEVLISSDVLADEDGYFNSSDEKEEVQAVCDNACGTLIRDGGRPNFAAMEELATKLSGCEVVAGETDSFGWLTGVIVLPNGRGRVVYG